MAYMENISIKQIAVNILQSLKMIKLPNPTPIGNMPVDVKNFSAALPLVTSVTTVTDFGNLAIWRENQTNRTIINSYNRQIVVKS